MTVTDARLLRKVIDDCRQALKDLCDPQRLTVMREDIDPDTGVMRGYKGVTRHLGDSLLKQLRTAVGSSTSRGGAAGKAAPIPISTDAHDLLVTIRKGVTRLEELVGLPLGTGSLEERLRAIVAEAGQWTDLNPVQGVQLALAGWVRGITVLLDPPRRWHLAAPCPDCGRSVVWRLDESIDEMVTQPALQVDGKTGCQCLACGAHWPPSHFELLASVLGCPPVGGAA